MSEIFFSVSTIKLALPVMVLATLWTWESVYPFFYWQNRLNHAAQNLLLAVFNIVIQSLVFGAATVYVAEWTTRNSFGLLNLIDVTVPLKFVVAMLLLDSWMYVWHRANHMIPFLWRFHRTHHSDNCMDVTTATRFHLGEHAIASLLRLVLIPLFGFGIWQIIIYDMMVVALTQFHHANISLGAWDRWVRIFIVTPDMHKMHHSRWKPETNSNYSVVLSVWDRLARSFRMRQDLTEINIGLDDFDDAKWQTFWGLLKTPFLPARRRPESQ